MKFVVCLEKQDLGDFSNEDITVGRVYELVEENAGNDMMYRSHAVRHYH